MTSASVHSDSAGTVGASSPQPSSLSLPSEYSSFSRSGTAGAADFARIKGDLDRSLFFSVSSSSSLTAKERGRLASDFARATNPASRLLRTLAVPTTASAADPLSPAEPHRPVKEIPMDSQAEQARHHVSPSRGGTCLHLLQNIQLK